MNYKEQEISGTVYKRASNININNPLDAPLTVSFQEEMVYNIDGQIIKQLSGNLTFNPNSTLDIEILDLDTNQPTGQKVTISEVCSIIYSLYIQEASKRDSSVGLNPVTPV